MRFWKVLGLCLPLCLGASEWKFSPGVSENDGVWKFENSAARVTSRDSAAFGTSGKGFTVSAAVRLRKGKAISGSGFDAQKRIIYQHDVIASKGGTFVFGRRSDAWVDQLYFNFNDGTKWAVPLQNGVATTPYDQWAVWTVVVQPQVKREEGRSVTLFTLFVNGEQELRKEVDGVPAACEEPLVFGCGNGINGDLWGFNGEMAEAAAFDRALSEDEVLALVQKSKMVRITAAASVPVGPELTEALKQCEPRAADAEARWRLAVLRRAAANGMDQTFLLSFVRSLAAGKSWETIPGAPVIATDGNLSVMIAEGSGKAGDPLMGAFDRIAQREIFGRSTSCWSAECAGNGFSRLVPQGAWRCVRSGEKEWTVTRTVAPQVTAKLVLTLRPDRLEAALSIDNRNPELRLKTVNFPQLRFAEKKSGAAYLVHPDQQGMLYKDPTRGTAPRPAWYPSGWLNMQFGAYYDDLSGVYLSPEDPSSGIKSYTVRGSGGDLECSWSIPVRCRSQKSGANSFPVNRAAIEVFRGDWFDAAVCYRRFALNGTLWSEPRSRETPRWLTENTLWFSHWTFADKDFDEMPGIMAKMRDYFEMPFAVHWYRWYDDSGMPHFLAKPRVKETHKKLHEIGIHTKAYIDTRLWSEKDGAGRQSDWMFSTHGKPSTLVNEDGSWNYERYTSACREVVMCPTAKLWQDYMLKVIERTKNDGFDMIYHDQVGASRPFPCFAAGHGHALNDPDSWLKGYRTLFRRIGELNSRYPELCHDTEDANEAWLNIMDGFLTWRWSSDQQIPLFAAVYGGRTQFLGRQYDQTCRGDEGSFFAKSAGQLVQNEQIGWFTTGMALQTPDRIRFVKQLAHLRKELLHYLNGGTMLKPLSFIEAPQSKTLLWGTTSTKPAPVTLPVIRHGIWQAPDKSAVIIWVNSDAVTQKARPVRPVGAWFLCRADGTVVEMGENDPVLELPAHGFEVWCSGSRPEAERIAAALKKISGFTAGKIMQAFGIIAPTETEAAVIGFEEFPVSGAYRGQGALRLAGDGKKTLQHKTKLVLRPNRRYHLRVALKREPDAKGYLGIANYSVKGELKRYATITQIPADGQWHVVEADFETDAEVYSTGLYLYNSASNGAIMMDEVILKEIPGGK